MKNFNEKITVLFEFTDIHCNNDAYCLEVIEKAKKLCEIFEFELEDEKINEIVGLPYLKFNLTFLKNIIFFENQINVIKAFAQEYQLTITSS